MNRNQAWYVGQRGELLAKEFLLDLGAIYVGAVKDADVGCDYIAFFQGDDEAIKVMGIEVKATETKISGSYFMDAKRFTALSRMNIPVLLTVIDVKDNEIFFHLLTNQHPEESVPISADKTAKIKVRKATPEERLALQREVRELK